MLAGQALAAGVSPINARSGSDAWLPLSWQGNRQRMRVRATALTLRGHGPNDHWELIGAVRRSTESSGATSYRSEKYGYRKAEHGPRGSGNALAQKQ